MTLMSETLLLLIQCQWSMTIIMLVDAMTNDDDKYCPGEFRGLNGSDLFDEEIEDEDLVP